MSFNDTFLFPKPNDAVSIPVSADVMDSAGAFTEALVVEVTPAAGFTATQKGLTQ
jgi:hypothetical protein